MNEAKASATMDITILHYRKNYRMEDLFTVKTVVAILRSLKADLFEEKEEE